MKHKKVQFLVDNLDDNKRTFRFLLPIRYQNCVHFSCMLLLFFSTQFAYIGREFNKRAFICWDRLSFCFRSVCLSLWFIEINAIFACKCLQSRRSGNVIIVFFGSIHIWNENHFKMYGFFEHVVLYFSIVVQLSSAYTERSVRLVEMNKNINDNDNDNANNDDYDKMPIEMCNVRDVCALCCCFVLTIISLYLVARQHDLVS